MCSLLRCGRRGTNMGKVLRFRTEHLTLVSKNGLTSNSVRMYNLGCKTDAEIPREKPACDRSSTTKIDSEIGENQPQALPGLHQTSRRGRAARRGTEPSAGSQVRPHLARIATGCGRS